MIAFAIRFVSVLFLACGVVTLPLPLPTGVVLIVVGLSLLASTSPPLSRALRNLRAKWPALNEKMEAAEKRAPWPIGKALRESRPDRDSLQETRGPLATRRREKSH